MTVAITDVVLRDAHQSLFATRLRLDDMLPVAAQLDDVGYRSLECWGGATFDACIRFLGEDPWVRLRELKKAMPKTPLQMLLRGQNLLGYRHYADDVVARFVERAVKNGIDVFRVFDAMNDPRNMQAALQAVRSHGAHAQGTLSYTTSPAHTLQTWLDLTEQLLETGVDSIAIKDMSGILTPHAAFELVSEIKKRYDVTLHLHLHLHCHATTGMAEMALLKAIEAGVDGVDTAISSMSATYGHPATEALVATLAGTQYDTGLNIHKLESIAACFREVRKKYHAFEGQLKGTDSRILVAQVPGGMLTNLEGQLKQQSAAHRLDEVLAEIPRVREDLGFIPLVTPTSQIVGTQAVLNVLTGERYKTIAKETAGILKGEYGHTPAPVNAALQARVLDGAEAITCRPADLLKPELAQLEADVKRQAREKNIQLAENAIDDVLTVALFPQPGLKFLENRHNPAAFEPVPQVEDARPAAPAKAAASGIYTVEVEGKAFVVKVSDGGDVSQLTAAAPVQAAAPAAPAGAGTPVTAPLAGTIWKVIAGEGQSVAEGEVLLILEAMKMETEIRAARAGTVRGIAVKAGDAVAVGDTLLQLA
ncbi:sodium-extruding oxaloacetate decarboxylase subunit alpha [Klebsiella quasipneumoniae]|uniref:sodium-extruding oxaloacetate decarboxylase subunit alpha n=3 Tax=Klebsiella quasipneumoniae TaxID=1463165 RepID=UPI0018A2F9CC|nr:sodium-extruding oxaloacetate decarboxylase subunit alpha [Klebsiella quasipneumoniae]MBF7753844.1 sodium-extruding oxaloacetate decarboxylase subunit alpha [Klebsiella quasipneumoniae]MBF7778485.1 sodium-extruding oxaloacetate decarboxylase subunit alpha [Klebsiella quasipneumoniae]HCD1997841.1 sodium-extruding oxaloacetate decarboxylase subunit alpha [Klebsiella quasipneumoniae]HDE0877961.1 sodium-extruding oxaloacetate decarboxylase subunit alpha [Klebsiella quasipneumoniae]HEK5026215.1 